MKKVAAPTTTAAPAASDSGVEPTILRAARTGRFCGRGAEQSDTVGVVNHAMSNPVPAV